MAHATVTLTGEFRKLDGSPAEGTVRVVPSVRELVDDAGDVILAGEQRFPLAAGAVSVDLPATDDPAYPPFTYAVSVAMHHAYIGPLTVHLPAAQASVDLTDLVTPGVTWVSQEYLNETLAGFPRLTESDEPGEYVIEGTA